MIIQCIRKKVYGENENGMEQTKLFIELLSGSF